MNWDLVKAVIKVCAMQVKCCMFKSDLCHGAMTLDKLLLIHITKIIFFAIHAAIPR